MFNNLNLSFIYNQEGGLKETAYVPLGADGKPLGKSGATIGVGVDLGGQEDDIILHGLSFEDRTALAPFIALDGLEALAILHEKEVRISKESAETLTNTVYEGIAEAIAKAYEDGTAIYGEEVDDNGKKIAIVGGKRFDRLPEPVATAIFSVAIQYGTSMPTRCPNFWNCVITRDFRGMVAELQDFHDAYDSRREAEAQLILDYLATQNEDFIPPVPETPDNSGGGANPT